MKTEKLKKLNNLKKRKTEKTEKPESVEGDWRSGTQAVRSPQWLLLLFNSIMRKMTGPSSSSSSSPSSSIKEKDAVCLIIHLCKKNHLPHIIIKEGEQPLWRPDCLSSGAPVPSLAGWTSGLFRFFRFFRGTQAVWPPQWLLPPF